MEEVVKSADGLVERVKVRTLPEYNQKVKGVIHWVSKQNSIDIEVRKLDVLFKHENVLAFASKEGKPFTDYYNDESLKVFSNAKTWNLHSSAKVLDRFQFERVGYYAVDQDSEKVGKLVFNSIVALKEASAKKASK